MAKRRAAALPRGREAAAVASSPRVYWNRPSSARGWEVWRKEDVVGRSCVCGLVRGAYSFVVPKGTGACLLEDGIRRRRERGQATYGALAYGAQPATPYLRRRLEATP